MNLRRRLARHQLLFLATTACWLSCAFASAAEPLAEGKMIAPAELEPIKARVSASLDSLWKALQKDASERSSV